MYFLTNHQYWHLSAIKERTRYVGQHGKVIRSLWGLGTIQATFLRRVVIYRVKKRTIVNAIQQAGR